MLIALFAGSPNQVFLRQTNQWRMVTCNPNYPRQTVMSLLSTRDGQILACLDDGKEIRIHQWSGGEFAPISAPLFEENTIQPPGSLAEAPDGSIWVCGTGCLVRWDRGGSKWTEYADLPSPQRPDQAGHAVFNAGSGAFWLSEQGAVAATNLAASPGDGSGLSWWITPGSSTVSELRRGNTIRRFDQVQTGLKQPRTVIWNSAGRAWVTGKTADGRNAIALFDGGTWQTLAPPDLQEKSFRPPVSQDNADFSDPGDGTWFLLSKPLTNQNLVEYSCVRVQGTNVETYTLAMDGFDRSWLRDLRTSPDGQVWLLGSAGLFQLDRASRQWSPIPAVGGRSVRASVSRPGEVWFVVTSFKEGGESGLTRYRRGEWRFFPAAMDPVSERVYRAADDSLYFWGKQCLYVVPMGPESSPVPLSLQQFGGRRQVTQLLKERSGNLWLTFSDGKQNSVMRYRPDRIPPDTQILDASAKVRQDGYFRAQIRGVERFVPLGGQKTFRFSWRFDDREWSPFQTLPEAGLSPAGLLLGPHRFQVRAQDEDLDIDPTPAEFPFAVVSVPLQERAWFKPVVVCLFLTVLGLALVATERAFKFARTNAALGRAHAELSHVNEGLEKRVEERTEQLRDEITQRQKSKIQFAAVLAERNRLAGELHDTLEQTLTGVSLQVEAVARHWAGTPEAAPKHLELARTLIRQGQAEVRRSVWDLRSQMLEADDLPSAFAAIGKRMTDGTPVRIEVEVRGTAQRLPEIIENQLFRIGQEAITNALKHARPGRILIVLSYQTDSLGLTVSDDGCGFQSNGPMSAGQGHFGLVGMRERAKRLGGKLAVESAPGQGTRVVVQVPVPGPATHST